MEAVGIVVFWIAILFLVVNIAWTWFLVNDRREMVRARVDLANDKKLFAMQRAGK